MFFANRSDEKNRQDWSAASIKLNVQYAQCRTGCKLCRLFKVINIER